MQPDPGDKRRVRQHLPLGDLNDDRAVAELTPQDHDIIVLAGKGLTEAQLANRLLPLGLSNTRFHARLRVLLESEAALAAHPVIVNRLRSAAAVRQQRRLGERHG